MQLPIQRARLKIAGLRAQLSTSRIGPLALEGHSRRPSPKEGNPLFWPGVGLSWRSRESAEARRHRNPAGREVVPTNVRENSLTSYLPEKTMGLLLLIVIVFLLLGGGGFALHGMLGTILIIFAVVWLLGGLGYHGSRSGWYGR